MGKINPVLGSYLPMGGGGCFVAQCGAVGFECFVGLFSRKNEERATFAQLPSGAKCQLFFNYSEHLTPFRHK